MNLDNYEIPEDFILDITKIPGSGSEVTLKAIEYHKNQVNDPDLPEILKEIAQAYVGNLTEYYEMSNLESDRLRIALPYLSESARFMESKSSTDVDIESFGRIKSFYSTYQKILDKIVENIERDLPIPTSGLLQDIYATRDVFHPRHDMRLNPQAFYKLTYKTILEYMEYIDSLSQVDNRYGLVKVNEFYRNNLERPKTFNFSTDRNDFSIPEKDFVDYVSEMKKVPQGYRYLPKLATNLSPSTILDEIKQLKQSNLSDKNEYSNSLIYKILSEQSAKKLLYTIKYHFENTLLSTLSKKQLTEYKSNSFAEFLEINEPYFSTYQIDCCNFIQHLNSSLRSNSISNQMPEINDKEFATDFMNALNIKFIPLYEDSVMQELQTIQQLPLDDFEDNLSKACKIDYFSQCCKDYMKYPKSSGYQSFHINIRTPFGIFEKQIRTEEQHTWAEFGPASHKYIYKPDVKTTFHRLKVPRPFSPKRNASGDIITPTELGVLPFDLSVQQYYGVPFSNFADGYSFSEFQNKFPTKEMFDQDLLDLTPKDTKFIDKLKDTITSYVVKKKTASNPTINTTTYSNSIEIIPNDIAVYPEQNIATTPTSSSQQTTNSHSTEDTDPHSNR